jgi:hypothetical protein
MARESAKSTKSKRKAAGKPRRPDHKDEATTDDFEREGMGVAAKE